MRASAKAASGPAGEARPAAKLQDEQEPADPRDKRTQEQAKSCEQARSHFGTSRRGDTSSRAAGRARNQRFRVTSAQEDGPVISGNEQGAGVSRASRTRGARAVRAEERERIQGRPSAAGRTYMEVAFSGSKGGGAFWILQSEAL